MEGSGSYLVFNLECVFECAIQLLYPHNKGSHVAADPKLTNVALLYGHLHYVSEVMQVYLQLLYLTRQENIHHVNKNTYGC